MTDRRWIKVAGLALCCWVANLLLAIGGAAAKDCGLTLLGSAEISIPHDGLVLAHVSVNAHPASMELDMSSVTSMIQEEYVQSLGLHNLPAPVHRDFVSESDTVEDVLRHLHLYYASKEQVLYFSAADAAAK